MFSIILKNTSMFLKKRKKLINGLLEETQVSGSKVSVIEPTEESTSIDSITMADVTSSTTGQ